MKYRKQFLLFIICLLVVLFSGPLYADTKSETVTLQLFWKHQYEFAGFYAAKEKGYYKDAVLEVAIKEYESGMNVTEEVLSDRVDFGTASSAATLDYLKGKPIKLLANVFKHSALVILSQSNSNIRLPHDLIGKKIMLTEHEKSSVEFQTFFFKNNIDPKNLDIIPHSFNVMDITNGKAGAMSAYVTNQPFILKQNQIPFSILDPASYGADFYVDSLITSASLAKKNPERVKAFTQASIKGWDYALKHPDEIIDLILAKYSSRKSREALQFEAKHTEKLILPDVYPLGSIDPERVRRIANTMQEVGLIKNTKALDSFFVGSSETVSPRNESSMLRQMAMLAISFIIVMAVVAALMKRLRPETFDRLLDGKINLPRIAATAVAFFLAMVILFAWYALKQMDTQLRQDLGANLATVNNSVDQALQLWKETQSQHVQHLAEEQGVPCHCIKKEGT